MPIKRLREIPQIVLAFDRDEAGEAMVQRTEQVLPECDRHLPDAKGWDEDLQRHLKQVRQQFEQLKQVQRSQEYD